MHDPVIENLEEILRGDQPRPAAAAHLSACASCRQEIAAMSVQHDLFGALRVREAAEPAPGFYARVMNQIETQVRPSVWSLFGDSLFARRLTYASLTFFVLLGTFFVGSADQTVMLNAPETIIASDEMYQTVSNNPERDRSTVLLHLATYDEE
jgi:hypothetical protein